MKYYRVMKKDNTTSKILQYWDCSGEDNLSAVKSLGPAIWKGVDHYNVSISVKPLSMYDLTINMYKGRIYGKPK